MASAVVCTVLVLGDIPAAPVLGVITFALVIMLLGHINNSYKTVGIGIAILFLATAAMIISAYASYTSGDYGTPGSGDPRPCNKAIPGDC